MCGALSYSRLGILTPDEMSRPLTLILGRNIPMTNCFCIHSLDLRLADDALGCT